MAEKQASTVLEGRLPTDDDNPTLPNDSDGDDGLSSYDDDFFPSSSHKRNVKARKTSNTPAAPVNEHNQIDSLSKVPLACLSEKHKYFTKAWWREVTARDEFWHHMLDMIPPATWKKRLAVTVVTGPSDQRRPNPITALTTKVTKSNGGHGKPIETHSEVNSNYIAEVTAPLKAVDQLKGAAQARKTIAGGNQDDEITTEEPANLNVSKANTRARSNNSRARNVKIPPTRAGKSIIEIHDHTNEAEETVAKKASVKRGVGKRKSTANAEEVEGEAIGQKKTKRAKISTNSADNMAQNSDKEKSLEVEQMPNAHDIAVLPSVESGEVSETAAKPEMDATETRAEQHLQPAEAKTLSPARTTYFDNGPNPDAPALSLVTKTDRHGTMSTESGSENQSVRDEAQTTTEVKLDKEAEEQRRTDDLNVAGDGLTCVSNEGNDEFAGESI